MSGIGATAPLVTSAAVSAAFGGGGGSPGRALIINSRAALLKHTFETQVRVLSNVLIIYF